MKVGDLVRYHRAGRIPLCGIILGLQLRSLEHYSQDRIDKDPIRTIEILCDSGKIIRRYAVHAEVISENR